MKRQDFEKKTQQFPILHYRDLLVVTSMSASYLSRQLSGWAKQGVLVQLKKGVYIHADKLGLVKRFTLANHLVRPSYISNESALHFWSMIPEATKTTTSITTKKTQQYATVQGIYMYHHISIQLFDGFLLQDDCLLAKPEKAILDYLWYHQEVLNTNLFASLRLRLPENFDQMICKKYLSRRPHQTFIDAVHQYFLDRL